MSQGARAVRLLGVLALLAAIGCARHGGAGAYQPGREDPELAALRGADQEQNQRIEAARALVRASPGGLDEAEALAAAVTEAHTLGVVERARLDGGALLVEAGAALDAAGSAHPKRKAEALLLKGLMLRASGWTAEGMVALRASMDARPSPEACIALIADLDEQGDPEKEILGLCKKARHNVEDQETLYALLQGCLVHTHAADIDSGLAWAGRDDIAFFKEYTTRIEAENAARIRAGQQRTGQGRGE